jgi:S1-C subfamily serine protease
MSAIPALVIGSLFHTLAPVPAEPKPDPLGRGYMGITVSVNSLLIESVETGKPAASAGVRAGDAIVRVGMLEPRVFEEVVAHICSFRPGAIVELEVQRGGERKVFKVKLIARPPELDINRLRPQIELIDPPQP